MDLHGQGTQRERIFAAAMAWADEAARLMSEARAIVHDQYFGLVATIENEATPEEIAALADIWAMSRKTIDDCVGAVSEGRREIDSVRAEAMAGTCIDEAWLAHRAANVARSLVKTKSLCAKMGQDSEEYNRIFATVKLRKHPTPPDDWQPPHGPNTSQDTLE